MLLTMASTQEFAEVTRRACLKLMLAAAVTRPLTGGRGTAPRAFQRYYQASAVITFCGVTIFSKKDVGGGYAVAEEAPQGHETAISLQFAGGSWPAKAHGVNRLGYIRESVVERADKALVQASYFGFMTSSTEKSFDQARKTFADRSSKPVPYSATEGKAGQGVWNFNLSRLMLSSNFTFSDIPRLTTVVRAAMAADQTPERTGTQFGTAPVPNTFLNSLRQALLNTEGSTDHSLVYNGKAYRMHCVKQADATLMRLNGTLEEQTTGHNTPFKLWYERDSPNYLPVKIEYRAKSFLKLVFETEPHWQGPAASLFLSKESA